LDLVPGLALFLGCRPSAACRGHDPRGAGSRSGSVSPVPPDAECRRHIRQFEPVSDRDASFGRGRCAATLAGV